MRNEEEREDEKLIYESANFDKEENKSIKNVRKRV